MTGNDFSNAVSILQSIGAIPSGHRWKTALANLLEVSRTTIYKFEKDGTDSVQTDLAIAALIAGLEPFPIVRQGARRMIADYKEPS